MRNWTFYDIQISLTYDNSTTSPVLYNNQKYKVSKFCLYSPSLNIFNNKNVNGELIVEHIPELGGNNLYVCVPIIQSTNTSTASDLITQIIQKVSTNAPSSGDSTNLNISGFSLETIIPKKPFFSYTNTSSMPGDYIVFGVMDAIPLSNETLKTFGSIIKPYTLTMSGGNLFFNPNGPNNLENEEDIYISCQPTGSSEEQTDITNYKNDTTSDFSSILNNAMFKKIIKILIACILFIFIYLIINYIYGYITGEPVKIPNFMKESKQS